jgi:hypothetical protein
MPARRSRTGVRDQLADGVVRFACEPRRVLHRDAGEVLRRPGQQHVDRNVRTAVILEGSAQPRRECAERADLSGRFRAHRALQRELGETGSEIAPQAVLRFVRSTVGDFVTRGERLEQQGDLADRMLQIVVHGDDDVVARGTDAAQQRIVLAVVTAQANAAHALVVECQPAHDIPRAIVAAVLDQDDLEALDQHGHRRHQLPMQLDEVRLGIEHRDHDRDAHPGKVGATHDAATRSSR